VSNPKVLVVDDEPDVVSLIERILTTEQFDVLTAYDGIGAMDLAENERPDLILLDIMMPMMSGYEVCEQLKANPATQQIPVVCLSSGAITLILKPFTQAELVAQIRRHLPKDGEA
jgi:DNA-binding response OmpR family regulator